MRKKRALAAEIAEAIHRREYRPGEWLRQVDLERRFRATRFDVRSALDELAIRRTIEHVRNRGYRVVEIDAATAEEIIKTRIILETATAPEIAACIDADGIARLEALAAAFGEAVRSGTRLEQSEANHRFHRLIYGYCGNATLEETIWALRDRLRGTNVTVWTSYEALLRSDAGHRAMIEALRARDATRLAALIADHIRGKGFSTETASTVSEVPRARSARSRRAG